VVTLWKSKNITLIIVFAVLGLVYGLCDSNGLLITWIPGVNFLFIIGYAIFISSQLLLCGAGRRWRFFISSVLFVFLITPTNFAGTPFDLLFRMPINSHCFSHWFILQQFLWIIWSHNKLFWWTILVSVEYNAIGPFLSILIYHFLYPPNFVASFINLVLLMLPVIIIESIAGGYVGHKIYGRIKKRKLFPQLKSP
jgi:hypothetical protein